MRREEKYAKNNLHTVSYNNNNPLTVNVDQTNRVYGHSNHGYISPVTIETPSPRSNGVFALPSNGVMQAEYVEPAGHRHRRHSFDMGTDRRVYTVKEGTLARGQKRSHDRPRDTRSLVGSTNTLMSTGSRVRTGTLVRPVYATTVTTLGTNGKKNSRRVVKSNSTLVGFEPLSSKKIALMEDGRYQALSYPGSPMSMSPPASPRPGRHHSSTRSDAVFFGPGVDDPDGTLVRWSPSMQRKMEARARIERLESPSAATSRRETPQAERKVYDLGERRYLYTVNGDLKV